MNYTKEQTELMITQYTTEPSMQTVESLAESLGKSTKSIIGKLSREGVYKRAVYKSKSGEVPVTKLELVNNIAENLGVEIESLVGLEKSPKATLKTLEVATGLAYSKGLATAEEKVKDYVRVQQALGGHSYD
jgi:hypothetical protein